MKRRLVGLALASVIAGFAAHDAKAQVVNEAFLAASCSGAGFSCAFSVQQAIGRLRQAGLSQAALNAQIGRIATIVASQVSGSTSLAARTRIAAALTVAVENTTDPAQAAAILGVAADIATSNEGTPITLPPAFASPA